VEITEVRIKLMEEPGERLQAFCSVTFDDCFVVRDLKIIDGTNGPFVAMPSRKLTSHCPQCRCKNHLRASYCNQCGAKLEENPVLKDDSGRAKLYADIAHPINSQCREMIQAAVIDAFQQEVQRAKQPGYVSTYDDYTSYEHDFGTTSVTTSHIQPAEKPHGPHVRSTETNASGNDEDQGDQGDRFGAGIFD
jgi:stage V sporulation protein G